MSQNKDNSKDDIVVKLKRVLIERDIFNSPNAKETDLVGYLPTVTYHPDANLED